VDLAYKAAARPAEPYDVQDAGDVTRLLRALAGHPCLRAAQARAPRRARPLPPRPRPAAPCALTRNSGASRE